MPTEKRPSRLIAEVDFEKDGAQHGFVRLFHSTHASAYGFLPIPIVVVKNGPGPTALFVSGNHGDEYEGQVALCNLAKSLDASRIRGRVVLRLSICSQRTEAEDLERTLEALAEAGRRAAGPGVA